MAESKDSSKPAKDKLAGRLKRSFPAEYLGKSLAEIKELVKNAKGPAKRKLQTAKKLLEQQERLMEKDFGS